MDYSSGESPHPTAGSAESIKVDWTDDPTHSKNGRLNRRKVIQKLRVASSYPAAFVTSCTLADTDKEAMEE